LDYSNLGVKSYRPAVGVGIASIAVGGLGTTLAFYITSTLNSVPPGSSIRPMGLSLIFMLIVIATFLIGLALSIICVAMGFRRWRLWLLALLGLAICSFGPWFVGQAEMHYVTAKNHLVWES
jgi:uncharacterized membrane protein YhaH (DUF805 family)